MSRATRIETVQNPAKKLLKWKSSEGTFQYWDKSIEQNVNVDLPFKFAILEERYVSFNGYDEDAGAGIWSNEVKEKGDMVTVRSGDKVIAEFKKEDWKNVKNNPELSSANYTQILYVAADLGEGWDIYRIMLNKSAFTGGIISDKKTGVQLPGQENDGWMSFIKNLTKQHGRNGVYDRYVIVKGSKSKKNGAVNFSIPVFESEEIDASMLDTFTKMAVTVDDYFLNKPSDVSEKTPAVADAHVPSGADIDDSEF